MWSRVVAVFGNSITVHDEVRPKIGVNGEAEIGTGVWDGRAFHTWAFTKIEANFRKSMMESQL